MDQWKDVGQRIWDRIGETRLTLISAGVAFYGLLALFPGIAALMALGGLVADPSSVTAFLDQIGALMPPAAEEIVIGQAKEVAGSDSGGLGLVAIFGVVLTIYSASKGMQALIDGINLVDGRDDDRSFVKATLLKLAMTAGLIIGVLLCVAVAALVPAAIALVPMPDALAETLRLAQWPVLLTIAALGIALTYRIAPAGPRIAWRWIVPGAGLACILWLIGSAAFALYVHYSNTYQETFGALGGVVILLMWLWLSATVVLFGALVARELRVSQ